MRFVNVFTLVAAAHLAAALPSVERATKACYTVDSGYFGGFSNETIHFGLDSHHRLVKADKGVVTQFKVDFQACPALGSQFPNVPSYLGRIVVTPSSFVGENTCLTVIAPLTGSGPWTAQAQTCGDATTPPASQKWVYGSDFGATIFWAGSAHCGDGDQAAGYWTHNDASNLPVITSGTHYIQISCDGSSTQNIESFSLSQ